MAINDNKITQVEIDANNVKSSSDTPTGTSMEIKNIFDKLPELIISKLNGLIDCLKSTVDGASGADNVGATATKTATTVQGQLEELYNDKVEKIVGKGLSENDFTSIQKTKLDGIAENANNYSLPTASATTLGGIKIGAGLEILGNGTVNGVSAPAPDLTARAQIAQEITDRTDADAAINQSITTLNTSLSTEITNRQNSDAQKLPLTGGTLSGTVQVKNSYPAVEVIDTDFPNEIGRLLKDGNGVFLQNLNVGVGYSQVLLRSFGAALADQISIYLSSGAEYKIYGQHNITVSTAAPTSALPNGAMHNVY